MVNSLDSGEIVRILGLSCGVDARLLARRVSPWPGEVLRAVDRHAGGIDRRECRVAPAQQRGERTEIAEVFPQNL